MKLRLNIIIFFFLLTSLNLFCQHNSLSGKIYSNGEVLPYVNIYLKDYTLGTASDSEGYYEIKNIPNGNHTLIISSIGYKTKSINIFFNNNQITRDFSLASDNSLDEVVISGTLRPVSKSNSPVPVEVYSETFFEKIRHHQSLNLYKMLMGYVLN